jgi:hypothetical protein
VTPSAPATAAAAGKPSISQQLARFAPVVCEPAEAKRRPRSAYDAKFSHRERANRGADARRLSRAEIEHKFFTNAERAVPRAQAERVLAAVDSLDRAPDLDELCAALAAP